MSVTIDGTTGITSTGGYTGDGISFADGTPSNTLVTTTGGNVGIGTSSPGAPLDVQAATGIIRNTATTGTNQVYVRQGNTGGYFYSGIDTSAGGFLTGAAYAGFHWMTGAYPMIFATNNAERMRIDSSGNVGIGTSSPSAKLNVYDGTSSSILASTPASDVQIAASSSGYGIVGTVGNYALVMRTNATERARIDSSGNFIVGTTTSDPSSTNYGIALRAPGVGSQIRMNTDGVIDANAVVIRKQGTDTTRITAAGSMVNLLNSYGGISDAKLKENIVDATPKLEKLNRVRIVNFNLIGNEQNQIGVIAQELEQIFPSMVEESIDQDIEGNDLGTTTKSVKYSVFVPMLIKAIQEQQAIIEQLRADVETLKAKP